MAQFGTVIKEKRKRKGWSQTVLGDLVGMSAATIHRIEHGERLPTDTELELFAETLSLDISQLSQFVTEDSQKSKDNIVPATSYLTQWDYAHPADYAGRVWIQIYPKATSANPLDIHIRWGAWQHTGSYLISGSNSLTLWHYKFNDGLGLPLTVTLSEACYVVFGKDSPPDKPVIDIIHQWQRIEPMTLFQTIRYLFNFIRVYITWRIQHLTNH